MTEKTRLTHEGAAMMNVALEAAAVFFQLREAGKGSGHTTPGGAGIWGFLHSLAIDGPQTVPQLARARPVSRQHIQTIANDAAAKGLVEFIDNPAHKRSKLVRITDKGRELHKSLTDSLAALAVDLAQGMNLADLEITARTLNEIRAKLAGGPVPLGRLAAPKPRT